MQPSHCEKTRGKGSYLVSSEDLIKPQINVCGKRILSSNNLSNLAFLGLIWLNIDILTLSVSVKKVTDAKLKKMMRFSVRFLSTFNKRFSFLTYQNVPLLVNLWRKIALKTSPAEVKRAQIDSRENGCVAPRVMPPPCPSGSKELRLQATFYINTFLIHDYWFSK